MCLILVVIVTVECDLFPNVLEEFFLYFTVESTNSEKIYISQANY